MHSICYFTLFRQFVSSLGECLQIFHNRDNPTIKRISFLRIPANGALAGKGDIRYTRKYKNDKIAHKCCIGIVQKGKR